MQNKLLEYVWVCVGIFLFTVMDPWPAASNGMTQLENFSFHPSTLNYLQHKYIWSS